MKKMLEQYAAYNVWANNRLIEVILAMDPELWHSAIPSSFNSLYKTILHIWDAESVWWQRVHNSDSIQAPSADASPDLFEVADGWQKQSAHWAQYIQDSISEAKLQEQLRYKNMKGEEFVQPLHEVLLHVFNHSTYHRGQLITMLRALGADTLPATDFVVFSRGR